VENPASRTPHQTWIEYSGVGHLRRKIDVPFVAQQKVKFVGKCRQRLSRQRLRVRSISSVHPHFSGVPSNALWVAARLSAPDLPVGSSRVTAQHAPDQLRDSFTCLMAGSARSIKAAPAGNLRGRSSWQSPISTSSASPSFQRIHSRY
jgi:hypothetical protein